MEDSKKMSVGLALATVKLWRKLENFLMADEEEMQQDCDLPAPVNAQEANARICWLKMMPVRVRNGVFKDRSIPKIRYQYRWKSGVSRIREGYALRADEKEEQRRKSFRILADSTSGLSLYPNLTLGHKRFLLKERLSLWSNKKAEECLMNQTADELAFQQFLAVCLDGINDNKD